jgi:molecular chaperone HtpG
VDRLTETLKERVKEVRVTLRLVDSPACVVVDENDMSPHLQRMLQAAGQAAPTVLPILEINPEHPLVKRIEQASDEQFGDWSSLLLDQALLADGSQLADPVGFVRRMNQLLLKT